MDEMLRRGHEKIALIGTATNQKILRYFNLTFLDYRLCLPPYLSLRKAGESMKCKYKKDNLKFSKWSDRYNMMV